MTYSYKKFFQNLYRLEGQKFEFCAQNTEETLLWQQEFRKALWNCLGLDKLQQIAEPCAQNGAVLIEELQEKGHVLRKYRMEVLPEVFLPFYMLIPRCVDFENPAKAMLVIPAHGANKNTVCGVSENQEEKNAIEKDPEGCYGLEFVRKGYVVFCPDPPGFGERVEDMPLEDQSYMPQKHRSSLDCSCKDLAQTAEALGLSLSGLCVWELMKIVDFVSQCPEVKKDEHGSIIGCAGFSGGGQHTMWLTALDGRLRLAVVSGYVHGYYDSMLECHLCPCNYVPNIWKMGDISDICSLVAPRPLFVENGIQDIENGPDGINGPVGQVKKIKKAYEIFGKNDALVHYTPDGPHRWYGGCYEFVRERL